MNPAALFAGGFAAGLAAGTASCTAVQGGLLIGVIRPSRRRAGSGDCCEQSVPVPGKAGDVAVVGAFLSGRLLSHVAAGALLGLAGSAVQISPRARAVLLVAAGIAVVILAARLLGRRDGSAGCAPPPPAVRTGIPRALGLGFATILVPCGVTISLEVVAVSTGSALRGAALLGGLALGTAPAFAALGLLLRGLASTRLAALAGIVALAAGIFTIASGLRLGGWLPDLGSPAADAGQARPNADGTQRITIWATEQGFRPGIASAPAGEPTEIVFRTQDNRGCTRTLAIEDRDVVLPITGEERVRLPPQPPGRLRYVCGMGMYVGFINFDRIP